MANSFSKEDSKLTDAKSSDLTQKLSDGEKPPLSSRDLNDEMSDFSDSLNFHRTGSKRSSPCDQTVCKKSRVAQDNIVTPKPSKEDLFETLFDKPKEIKPSAPKPEIPVRPMNPLKPYYDIASLHSRKRQYVGNNFVFPAFSHKRPRMMGQQKNNTPNVAYFSYLPQPSGFHLQAMQPNNAFQYTQRPRKQAKRNITSIPSLATINQQPVLIDLTATSQQQ